MLAWFSKTQRFRVCLPKKGNQPSSRCNFRSTRSTVHKGHIFPTLTCRAEPEIEMGFCRCGRSNFDTSKKKIDAYSQRMRVIVQGSLWRHKLYYPLRKANFNRYVRSNRSSPCNLPKHLSGSSSDQTSPPASGSSASIESQPKWIGTFYPSS